MDLELLKNLDVENSILFLGAGFSVDAFNIKNEKLPTGKQLKQNFLEILDVEDNNYDLKILADEINEREDVDLYQIIYETFTVKSYSEDQALILKLPWRRIYTTNYDDVVECFRVKSDIKLNSFCHTDAKPRKIPKGSVVHLHGIVRNLSADNVLDQLVLNEASYIRQTFDASSWNDEFVRDLKFSEKCFVVGYSLSDYHITGKILSKIPSGKSKIFVVTKNLSDEMLKKRMQNFGTLLDIGVSGFADFCKNIKEPEKSNDLNMLKSFDYMDPFLDKKSLAQPTANEVLNLMAYGSFNYQRCLSSLSNYDPSYVVPRYSTINEIIDYIKDNNCFLLHSRIGNGKTIFTNILSYKLSEMGFKCVKRKFSSPLVPSDLDILKQHKDLVVFIDDYDAAVEIIGELSNEIVDSKFIITVRTSVQELRLHEALKLFPKPLKRVDLNYLNQDDKEDFKRILDFSGLNTRNIEGIIEKGRDFREIVLDLYKNEAIREKIDQALKPLFHDREFKKVFVISHLLKSTGVDADSGFLNNVSRVDAYEKLICYPEVSNDIFILSDNSVRVRSSIFSEYIIKEYFDPNDIVDGVSSIIVEAVKRKSERRYQSILSSVMKFSFIKKCLSRYGDSKSYITSIFEDLRRDIEVNQEPLFWLQYSIFQLDYNDFELADSFLQTAYDRAKENKGFRTFQLDTYALKLILLIESEKKEFLSADKFEEICERIEQVRMMITDENHRSFAIKVFHDFELFVKNKKEYIGNSEKAALTFYLNLVVKDMETLTQEQKLATDVTSVIGSLHRATSLLI
ncbi:SIR2 family protein [Kiloniella sp. b19]|uniref:SIR2 family protein n=1 Tax=Kiloniella sp. GXU_MW_B19 TaxID=3141326 RepID=UPI0031DD7ED0